MLRPTVLLLVCCEQTFVLEKYAWLFFLVPVQSVRAVVVLAYIGLHFGMAVTLCAPHATRQRSLLSVSERD